jgi:DHA1 family tetracycline resistance protein-like MFS transporter
MGLIGMAFGIGFVLGPVLGGVLVSLPLPEEWRLRLPFLVGALLSTIAFLLVITRLPESLPADPTSRKASRVPTWHGLVETITHPTIGLLVGVGFLVVFAFAALEGTFSLFLRERMGWLAGRGAFAFSYLGLISAVVQGGLIRRLVPRYSEPRLIASGILALVVGLTSLAFASSTPALLVATLVVAIGQGLYSPTISGLLSRVTSPSEQGAIFGTLSSAQTLARMISYALANVLLARSGPSAPYLTGGAVGLAAFLLALVAARRLASEPHSLVTEADAFIS